MSDWPLEPMDPPVAPRRGGTRHAYELGYLRRPEIDSPCFDAWEAPDGVVIHVPKRRAPYVTRTAEGVVITTRPK